jgi:4-amino-4-deoxy-L-arabinose transferase-like glycosyltransferase
MNLVGELLAHRISVVLFVFLINFALFRFSAVLFGPWIAGFVTVSYALLPRVFFHSHLGTLEYPMVALWFFVLYAYWRGMRERRWVYVAAVVLGLALLTKINGFFLYVPVVVLLALYFDRSEPRRSLAKLLPMLVIPPLVLVLGWPWLWPNPAARLVGYFAVFPDTTIPTYYLGVQHGAAPLHLPFVLAFLTLPLVVWVPALMGSFVGWTDTRAKLFIGFNALYPMVMIALSPSKHDGIRLFLPAFPFVCMLAGGGLYWVLSKLEPRGWSRLFRAGALALLAVSLFFSVVAYHPYQSSYFGEVIGGVDGARRLGFEVHYWCSAYKDLAPWLAENSGKSYHVPTCTHLLDFYRKQGALDSSVRFRPPWEADRVVLVGRFGVFRDEAWDYYRNREPVFSVKVSNTTILGVYELEQPVSSFCEPNY